jgi:hypothetical protein
MEKPFALSLEKERAAAMITRLSQCNELTEKYGLSLSEGDMRMLAEARGNALRSTGRVEFGAGALPGLIYAFCDSPYLLRTEYAQTLAALQELFYAFKNEYGDAFSDDELTEAMEKLYDGRLQGSLEALENATGGDLYRALTGGEDDEYDE